MNAKTRRRSLGLLCLLGFAAGCGSEGGRYPVSGSVTFRGRAVERGSITFLTTDDEPAPVCGASILRGTFAVPAARGLEPGTYRVLISSPGPPATPTPQEIAEGVSARAAEQIPAEYNAASKLTAEVRPGAANHFEFRLE